VVPIIFLILLFVALLIATYRDMRTREVPDTLTYGLIVLGLLGGLIGALLLQDLNFFLEHLYGFLIGAGIGVLMFYARQWGGGDAKLIMGVGAILGFSFQNWQLLEFVILLIFCGAIYGVGYTAYLAIINRKAFMKEFVAFRRTKFIHRLLVGLVSTGFVCVVLVFFVPMDVKITLAFFILGLYILTYAWICTRVIERSVMLKEYPVGKLTEGDWIVEEVKIRGKVLVAAKNTGVTLEQIAALKRAKVKKVMVKEGIPFVPGFLLAFIVLVILQMTLGDQRILALFF
jgi:Flp pilus assembly protein protease CpaA